MATIMLIGASGQLGCDLKEALLYHNHSLIALTRDELDVTQKYVVDAVIQKSKVDLVINASAYTNVEQAEDDKEQAFLVNATAAQNIAKACRAVDIPLIHISTDYVFYKGSGPHAENDETCSLSVYGQSKLEGEGLILQEHNKAIIIRTSWLFGRYGNNFVKTMLKLSQSRDNVSVVCDQYGSPTPAHALAEAIVKMLDKIFAQDFNEYGIYHYSGMPYCNWADFARDIMYRAYNAHFCEKEVEVFDINSDEFKCKAKRPLDSRLSCERIKQVFDIDMPFWQDYIKEIIDYESTIS